MTAERSPRPIRRAAVVLPELSRRDAIAQAAVDTWRLLNSLPDMQATLLTTGSDRPEVPAEIADGVADLLVSPAFLAADLVVYHFGRYNPIFDALLVGNGHGRQVVHFHNVTRGQSLGPNDGLLVQRPLDQLWNFRHADAIWAVSSTDRNTLLNSGLQHPPAEVIPLVVDVPARARLSAKRAGTVEILFLGNFVQSDGVLELLQVLADVVVRRGPSFRLRLAGDQDCSDHDYVEAVRRNSEALGGKVEFLGTVSDTLRDELLYAAHIMAIPSYHAGFGRAALEGLRAGCIPVGYAADNLPNICVGLGRLVPPGDVAALADALAEVIEDVAAVTSGGQGSLRIDRGATELAAFDSLVETHVRGFEFHAVRELTRRSLQRLFPDSGASKMSDRQPPLPLRREHVDGARLFADRHDLVRGLRLPTGGVIAELGVALGDFSEFLMQTLSPRRFVAVDIWTMHEWPEHWGQRSEVLFQGNTHRGFYEERFRSRGDQVVIESGLSYDAIERYPDACFDMIYIDAGHDYDSVRKDALVSARKVKRDGTLIFNDYILYDHMTNSPYGVVHAVNEMVVEENWKVVGFALNNSMFCDIALRRLA
jgi:glycosyltransferase involved in cell wall biosynthesis